MIPVLKAQRRELLRYVASHWRANRQGRYGSKAPPDLRQLLGQSGRVALCAWPSGPQRLWALERELMMFRR
jgi:hypothetical protein